MMLMIYDLMYLTCALLKGKRRPIDLDASHRRHLQHNESRCRIAFAYFVDPGTEILFSALGPLLWNIRYYPRGFLRLA
jgi:hypothetical protein